MNERNIKVMTTFYITLFVLSLSQPYFVDGTTKIYFYHLAMFSITIISAIYYTVSAYSNSKYINKMCSLVLFLCYFLTFHSIYTMNCRDNYLIAFLYAKEIIITFVIFATRYLFLKLEKSDKKLDLYAVSKFTICILAFFTLFIIYIEKTVPLCNGVLIYIASLVMLLITDVLIRHKDIEFIEKKIGDDIEVADEFIFANYIDYTKGRAQTDLAFILNCEKRKEIVIGIYDAEWNLLPIDYSKITKIDLLDEKIDVNNLKIMNVEPAQIALKDALEGYMGDTRERFELEKQLGKYEQSRSRYLRHVIVFYVYRKKSKCIHLYTKENEQFFETLERTLPFPIEKK